jgi:hypothetical protein
MSKAKELVKAQPQELAAPTKENVLTSYNREDKAQALLLWSALSHSDSSADDLVGQQIEVEHFVQHWITRVDDETGEVRDVLRTVLVGPDGKRVSTGSETISKSIAMAARVFGVRPPFDPPLRFVVREGRSRTKKRRFLYVELAKEG